MPISHDLHVKEHYLLDSHERVVALLISLCDVSARSYQRISPCMHFVGCLAVWFESAFCMSFFCCMQQLQDDDACMALADDTQSVAMAVVGSFDSTYHCVVIHFLDCSNVQ